LSAITAALISIFSQQQAKQTKKIFERIQKEVEMMVEMFKRCNFLLHVASKQSYEEGFKFTEHNIISYLAELEEYIAALITYTAWKLNAPNHATAFIPFDALPVKEFKDLDTKKDLTVSLTALYLL
jgi:phosphoheptose isomerase